MTACLASTPNSTGSKSSAVAKKNAICPPPKDPKSRNISSLRSNRSDRSSAKGDRSRRVPSPGLLSDFECQVATAHHSPTSLREPQSYSQAMLQRLEQWRRQAPQHLRPRVGIDGVEHET